MVYTLTCNQHAHPELARGVPQEGLLTVEERAVFQKLKTQKRRQDWLTGRFAAKQLVQRAVQEEYGRLVSLSDFAIIKKENGAPALHWLNDGERPQVTLSISHAGGLACCALRLGGKGYLGCDVEQAVPRSETFITDYFTPAEQELVARTHTAQQTILVNAIWSGKEAALKALELGLRVDTRAVTCLPSLDRLSVWEPLAITLDSDRIPCSAPPLAGWWRLQGPFVFTLVAPAAELAAEKIMEMEKWVHD